MAYLTDTIRTLCEGIIEKNQKYKTKKDWFDQRAKKSLVDNFGTIAFLDKEKNVVIITERDDIGLESFNKIEGTAMKILSGSKQVISSDGFFPRYVALQKNDIQISHAEPFRDPNPVKEMLSKDSRETASSLFVKDNQAFVARSLPAGREDAHYHLGLATQEELKKVIGLLTTML